MISPIITQCSTKYSHLRDNTNRDSFLKPKNIVVFVTFQCLFSLLNMNTVIDNIRRVSDYLNHRAKLLRAALKFIKSSFPRILDGSPLENPEVLAKRVFDTYLRNTNLKENTEYNYVARVHVETTSEFGGHNLKLTIQVPNLTGEAATEFVFVFGRNGFLCDYVRLTGRHPMVEWT